MWSHTWNATHLMFQQVYYENQYCRNLSPTCVTPAGLSEHLVEMDAAGASVPDWVAQLQSMSASAFRVWAGILFFPGAYFSIQTKRVYLTPKWTTVSLGQTFFTLSYLSFGNSPMVSETSDMTAAVLQAVGERHQGWGSLEGTLGGGATLGLGSVEVGCTHHAKAGNTKLQRTKPNIYPNLGQYSQQK